MGTFRSIASELLARDSEQGTLVAGFDEVGRGSFAGDIVGAVVAYRVADIGDDALVALGNVRDSKTLSHGRRAVAAAGIKEHSFGYAVFAHTPAEIDEYGIQACNESLLASAISWAEEHGCDVLVADGTLPLGRHGIRVLVEPKADGRYLSVASASIIAKEHRDADMRRAGIEYPGYGFGHNMGYGSEDHCKALKELGTTPIHRMSWKPCRDL